MIVAGISEEQIHVELEILKKDFDIQSDVIEKEFRKMDWLLPTKVRILEFQELIWRHRYNIFSEIEKAANQNTLM